MKLPLAEKITHKFIANGIVNAEDEEIYIYGLNQSFSIIFNIMTTIAIGLIFGMLTQCVIFSIAYIPLRTFAGGYHSKTQLRCYLFSVILNSCSLLVIKIVVQHIFIELAILLAAIMIIIYLAPVEDLNKPLNKKEKNTYRKRTMIILSIFTATALIFLFFGKSNISACIIIAFLVQSIMLVLGKIKNRKLAKANFSPTP